MKPSSRKRSPSRARKQLPVIPAGFDAYRLWEQWPLQRIGIRASMRSTRDRSGANEAACASHYLYQERPDFNVVAHAEGEGVLYFWRANCWHGSPWHYEIDGVDHVVEETATQDPVKWIRDFRWAPDPPPSSFEPSTAFQEPLAWTWTRTRGADLNWTAIPFNESFRMAYGRTCYGTGYGIYHRIMPGTPLSMPLGSFDWNAGPPKDVAALLGRAGKDIAPKSGRKGVRTQHGVIALRPGEVTTLTELAAAPAMLRALEFSAPRGHAVDFGAVWLRITWDNRRHASIDAPVALFFGAAHLHNRDDREYLVKALPMHIRFDAKRVHLACYFPMPFFRSARIELVSRAGSVIPDVRWSARTCPYDGPRNHAGYFHATYATHPHPAQGEDLVLLDTREVEGGGDWTGSFVGTSWIFTKQNYLGTLEGIPRFFFDDALMPQGYGTGTEEWGGGGDYWGGLNMTLPLAGHPCGLRAPQRMVNHANGQERHECLDPLDMVHSAYRFLLADLMPFGKNALIRLEHGGENETNEHYETVTYWYGLPGASLVRTDELNIGNAQSERAHAYRAPGASKPAKITSRYEWGVDHLHGREIYPASTDTGRHHRGVSEFTLTLDPENVGVMLRRKLDYLYPNQKAKVFVADAGSDEWKPVGVWFTPGSNTCVFAQPAEKGPEREAAPPFNQERTVNRRFYESEFLIGSEHTEGRKAIRVRIEHVPMDIELWPGKPFPEQSAWSEMRYWAYCYVMPPLP